MTVPKVQTQTVPVSSMLCFLEVFPPCLCTLYKCIEPLSSLSLLSVGCVKFYWLRQKPKVLRSCLCVSVCLGYYAQEGFLRV